MEKMLPKLVWTLGDYYQTKFLRDMCHAIKNGTAEDMLYEFVARKLAALIPDDAILVPVPCSSHYYTDKLAQEIAYYKWPGEIPRANHFCNTFLDTVKDGTLYDKKKAGLQISEADCGFVLTGLVPEGNIVLVDNVVATGTTISAAMRLIGRRCSVAAVAVDSKDLSSNQ